MSDETWELQATQWGHQSALFTPDAASVKLVSLVIDDEPAPTFVEYGRAGEFGMSGEAPSTTSSTHKLSGMLTYNEATWLLDACLGQTSVAHPSGGTSSWERIYTPAPDEPWTPLLLTQERGIIGGRGRQYADYVVSGFAIDCGPDKYDLTGDAFAAAVATAVDMTGSLSSLAQILVLGPDTKVYLDTSNAFAGSPTQLTRYFECKWGIAGKYAPEWSGGVNAYNGYSLIGQTQPKMTGQLTVEADSTIEDLILGLQSTDAIGYLRIESISKINAESGHPYKLVIDSAIKFVKQTAYKKVGKASALLGNDFPFTIVKDPAWTTVLTGGQFFSIDLVNTVAAIA